jgi:ATPase family associated with various cellular activities (AAA)
MANEQYMETQKRSSYSDFVGEAKTILQKKDNFQQMLSEWDFNIAWNRETAAKTARLMMGDIPIDVYPPEDLNNLYGALSLMNQYNHQLLTLVGEQSRSQYIQHWWNAANKWYSYWSATLVHTGHSSKYKGEKDFFTRMYNIADISQNMKFNNSFGVPISPQMEFFARMLSQRRESQRDNVIIVEGPTGEGKTTFAYALATTVAEMNGMPFDVGKNMVLGESKEYAFKLLQTAERGSVFLFDESGNQINKKRWHDSDQIDFTNMINLVRFMGFTVIMNWPQASELDKSIRDSRTKFKISIKKRGNALVRTANLNPTEGSKDFKPKALQGKVVSSSGEAQELLEEHDLSTVLTIPFYQVSGKPWDMYEVRKGQALERSRLTKEKKPTNRTSFEVEAQFLMNLPPDKMVITSKEVDRAANTVGFNMTIETIAKRIAKAIGLPKSKVITYTNPQDVKEAIINITPVIRGYIDNLKGEKAGAEERKADTPSESFDT